MHNVHLTSLQWYMIYPYSVNCAESTDEVWLLTDIANSTQLGTTGRLVAKEMKIQAANIHTKKEERKELNVKVEEDKTTSNEANSPNSAKKNDAGDKVESDAFIRDVQDAVLKDGKIKRKLAHSMFVGPTGSGKSSLMDRLLKRARRKLALSTGVCDRIVIVDIDVDNPSTFHSITVIDPNTWEEVEYDVSLVRQMNPASVTTSLPEVQPKLASPSDEIRITPEYSEMAPSSSANSMSPQSPSVVPSDEDISENTAKVKPTSAVSKTNLSDSEIREVIFSAIAKCGGFEGFQAFLTKSASLYLRDTGGQVEFQEMISLLVFGPSIFLFVFRADLDFQSKFSIEYRASKGETTNSYTSSITTEEALVQCLASVYAMDTQGKAEVKTHKPLVFIIGTHKDQLGQLADEKIAKLNKHLDSVIVKTGFQDLVQYADADKSQVMFAVDNTSESDEDFQVIRSKIHSLISGRDEFTIEYRMTYLLFCLELQNLKRSVLSLDECKVMAAKYGIVGDEVSHLLEFLHLRIGVIQYHNVDGLRHIVVKEPQVLFNKVTDLIIRTFSCKALIGKEQRYFQKGILTASVFKMVTGSDDQITCEEFLKLLVHLRIITPYPSTTPGSKEKRYFIPCVLNHVQESSEEELHTDILPLSVQFQCSHCPKGLFGVLVTHLMTPESDGEPDDSHISFALNEKKIFKDQVSFNVCCYADEDELCLKMLPSHLEVKFFPSQSDSRDLSLGEVCSSIRQVIETSIHKSLEDLHYDKQNVKPMMCFRCELCSELHRVKKGKDHCKVFCKATHRNSRIAEQGRVWYNEGEHAKIKLFQIRHNNMFPNLVDRSEQISSPLPVGATPRPMTSLHQTPKTGLYKLLHEGCASNNKFLEGTGPKRTSCSLHLDSI